MEIWGRTPQIISVVLITVQNNMYELLFCPFVFEYMHIWNEMNYKKKHLIEKLTTSSKCIGYWRLNLKNVRNPGSWVLIWEYTARAIQWIPTGQGLDDFQNSLRSCALDETSLSIETILTKKQVAAYEKQPYLSVTSKGRVWLDYLKRMKNIFFCAVCIQP